jgi:putative glutamine amidotransferase
MDSSQPKTGWPPPELAQDDCRGLFHWFASKPDSRRLAREAALKIFKRGSLTKDKPFSVLYSAIYGDDEPFDALVAGAAKTEVVREPAEMLDFRGALIVWGGTDIGPQIYGHPTSRRTAPYAPKRDEVEVRLIKEAIEMDIPIIGICRGAQLLCAVAGGFLLQDVNNHAGNGHSVITHDGKALWVNSLHHQMMVPYGVEHEMVAWSESVRGAPYIFKDDKLFVPSEYGYSEDNNPWREPEFVYFPKIKGYAIQWHPEMMSPEVPSTQYILNYIREKEVSRKKTEASNAA